MEAPSRENLFYIDQNVVSLIADGKYELPKIEGCTFVYSKEHFNEISRSQEPQKYLDALERANAELITVNIDKINQGIDAAKIHYRNSPTQLYDAHCKEQESRPDYIARLVDPMITLFTGGGRENKEVLQRMPAEWEELHTSTDQIKRSDPELYKRLPLIMALREPSQVLAEYMINWGGNAEEIRAHLGNEKGHFGGLQGRDKIGQMWKFISSKVPDLGATSDEFFGFSPFPGEGQKKLPLFSSIQQCCLMLDIVGFHSEKKIRKLGDVPNIRSDGTHIAMAGAFCWILLSRDKKLLGKATAIYEHKNIPTLPCQLTEHGAEWCCNLYEDYAEWLRSMEVEEQFIQLLEAIF